MSDRADSIAGADLQTRADWLFRQECRFVAGAAEAARIPPPELPEIAFVGRSNVGKSTLINALMGRKHLVRTSNTPGRTQQINFFNLGQKLMLIDLPGYGYAKVSRTDVEAWGRLIDAYLRERPNLMRVCVLIDSRHGVKDTDVQMVQMLDEYKMPAQLILTKSDKASKAERDEALASAEELMRASGFAIERVYQSSSVYTDSLGAIRAELTAAAGL